MDAMDLSKTKPKPGPVNRFHSARSAEWVSMAHVRATRNVFTAETRASRTGPPGVKIFITGAAAKKTDTNQVEDKELKDATSIEGEKSCKSQIVIALSISK